MFRKFINVPSVTVGHFQFLCQGSTHLLDENSGAITGNIFGQIFNPIQFAWSVLVLSGLVPRLTANDCLINFNSVGNVHVVVNLFIQWFKGNEPGQCWYFHNFRKPFVKSVLAADAGS